MGKTERKIPSKDPTPPPIKQPEPSEPAEEPEPSPIPQPGPSVMPGREIFPSDGDDFHIDQPKPSWHEKDNKD